MKHLPRSSLFRFACFAILALLLLPLALAAASSFTVSPPGFGLAAASIFGITSITLREQASEEGAGGGGGTVPTPAEALQTIEDRTMPMSQRLTVAANALKGIDPTNQLAALKAELNQARSDLKASGEQITKLKAELETAQKQITALEADAAEHEKALAAAEKEAADLRAKEQDIDKRANSKSKERLGALGFPSSQAPAASDKPTAADALEDLRASFKAETDPAKKSKLAKQIRALEAKEG